MWWTVRIQHKKAGRRYKRRKGGTAEGGATAIPTLLGGRCTARPARYPQPVCARFTVRKKHLKEIADDLDAEFSADDEPLYRPRYNVAPTDLT